VNKVVFEDEQQAITRRRSSMVATYEPDPDKDVKVPVTDCFVHQLLEGHRRSAAEKHDGLHPGIQGRNNDSRGIPNIAEDLHNHVQSRLLSKKQLSDMAYSIRELSKRLAHIKIKLVVHNIFILGQAHDEEVVRYTHQLARWLLKKDSHHKVYI
jgi:NAD+ kinase